MELLNHVIKRLQSRKQVQLPVTSLIDQLNNEKSSPIVQVLPLPATILYSVTLFRILY